MFKCYCCGSDMTRCDLEKYDEMSQEQINVLIKEHKEGCSWAKQLQFYYDGLKNNDDLEYGDLNAIQMFKAEVLYDVLLEKGLIDKEDFKNRMIMKANRAIDFKARDRMVKFIEEK